MSQLNTQPVASLFNSDLYESLSAEQVIERVLAENSGLPCFTCSFQAVTQT